MHPFTCNTWHPMYLMKNSAQFSSGNLACFSCQRFIQLNLWSPSLKVITVTAPLRVLELFLDIELGVMEDHKNENVILPRCGPGMQVRVTPKSRRPSTSVLSAVVGVTAFSPLSFLPAAVTTELSRNLMPLHRFFTPFCITRFCLL